MKKESSLVTRAVLGLLVAGLLVLSGCGSPFGGEDEPEWTDAPIVPELTGELKDRFLTDVSVADSRGMRPEVFAKVGDSNTELRQNIYGIGCSEVEYGEQEEYEPTVEKYRSVEFTPDLALPGCLPANSFSRNSAAARSGSYSIYGASALNENPNPVARTDPRCQTGETPITCEIRLIKPRYTIVMTGTNDYSFELTHEITNPDFTIGPRMGFIVNRIRAAGSVPVLSTLPPYSIKDTPEVDEWEGIKQVNEAIYEAGKLLKVPVINLWSALTEEQMIDNGLTFDGVHLNVLGGAQSPDVLANSANFSEEALRYGANRRNLIWVQTLAALDEAAASE